MCLARCPSYRMLHGDVMSQVRRELEELNEYTDELEERIDEQHDIIARQARLCLLPSLPPHLSLVPNCPHFLLSQS